MATRRKAPKSQKKKKKKSYWGLGVGLPEPIFHPGRIVMTQGAVQALEKSGDLPEMFLDRHVSGDWGNIPAEDIPMNQEGVKDKGMILSSYKTSAGDRIWVITDPGHATTTLLLPEEY